VFARDCMMLSAGIQLSWFDWPRSLRGALMGLYHVIRVVLRGFAVGLASSRVSGASAEISQRVRQERLRNGVSNRMDDGCT
jgi:hypothetical protein